jgi:hypothetical protein
MLPKAVVFTWMNVMCINLETKKLYFEYVRRKMFLNTVGGLDWIGQVILFSKWRNFELLYTKQTLSVKCHILFIHNV